MVKIVYRVLVHAGQERTFQSLADATLIPEAKKLSGCRVFSLFRNSTNKREFIFFELWDSAESVHVYKQRLIALLGDPRPGEEFPEAMNRFIAEDEDLI